MYGTVILNNRVFSVGYMNNNALDLGNIKVEYGTMPSRNNEIIVEEFVASALKFNKDNIEDGYQLNINGKKIKIVGVLYNYSANFSVPINLIKGINDFPNILTYKDNPLFNTPSSNNFMIINEGAIKVNANNYTTSIMNDYEQLGFDSAKLKLNHNLFNRGLKYYDKNFFSVIIF